MGAPPTTLAADPTAIVVAVVVDVKAHAVAVRAEEAFPPSNLGSSATAGRFRPESAAAAPASHSAEPGPDAGVVAGRTGPRSGCAETGGVYYPRGSAPLHGLNSAKGSTSGGLRFARTFALSLSFNDLTKSHPACIMNLPLTPHGFGKVFPCRIQGPLEMKRMPPFLLPGLPAESPLRWISRCVVQHAGPA